VSTFYRWLRIFCEKGQDSKSKAGFTAFNLSEASAVGGARAERSDAHHRKENPLIQN
jgi:hypothetical protein